MSDESDPEFIPEDNEFGTADDGPAERGEDGRGDTEEAKSMEDADEPRRGKGKGKGRGGRRGRPSVTKGWRICAACAKHFHRRAWAWVPGSASRTSLRFRI